MSVICEDIPHSEEVQKALYGNVPSMIRVRYAGERKIPGIDATKLAPCVLPVFYKKFANDIEAFNVHEDDVWVTSFPKSGTTWAQEMVWLIANDLDFDRAKKYQLSQRYGFFEFSSVIRDYTIFTPLSSVEIVKQMVRPRFIKSHLPISLLPTEFWTIQPKLVYVARNPKDTAISYYHHFVNLQHYRGTLEDSMETFLNGLTPWSPYSDHILGYWNIRNEKNILFITYEDMLTDLKSVLLKVVNFFGKTYTDEQLNQLAKHLSFNEMKKNDSVNYEDIVKVFEKAFDEKRADENFRFMRRGQFNSANDEMPVEYQKKFDDFVANSFKDSDYKFNV